LPEPKRTFKVFLCHAHADREAVRSLYTRLTNEGVDAWLDKEKLLPGQDWELEIGKAVRESDVVIVCLSKQFNQAGFRQKEVRFAINAAMEQPEGEIFIIPARLEVCDTLESLNKWQWVDLFENDGYKRLIVALRARADKIGATFNRHTIKRGDWIGERYQVVRLLNTTNYSQLAEAWDARLQRKVAIKSLYLAESDNDALERLKNLFVREAITLRRLVHPNIPYIYDVIVNPIGLVIEWIEGTSLQAVQEERKVFATPEVIHLGIVLAEALSYVHEHGVVHRDIKPSHIMINTSNQPILTDFGIAHLSSSEDISYNREDGTYFYVGTRDYSAPEQLEEPQNVTVKADIFSLGIVFYEMLTLAKPFRFGNMPYFYSDRRLPSPEQHDISQELFEVLCRMLAQDSDERPSALELKGLLLALQS